MALSEQEEIEYLSLLEAEHREQIKSRDMMPQTDDELWRYIRAFFGVRVPCVSVCSGHVSPFQFVADVFFQRELNVLGFASRDSGKTKNMSIIHQLNSHFKAGCDSCSVGAIELQAKKCYQYIQEYASGRGWYGDIVETSRIGDTIYKNGSKVSILPGTISSVNCISGDTRVDCPRNINQYRKGIPIRELVGKEFFVYSFNCEKRCVELKKAFNVHCSGLNVPVYEVVFEWTKRGANKKNKAYATKKRVGTIKTTGHHLFLLKNGQYKRADCLQEEDRLEPFIFRWEGKKNIINRKQYTRLIKTKDKYTPEHRFVYQSIYGKVNSSIDIHHQDNNHQNNNPENLVAIDKQKHFQLHFGDNAQNYINKDTIERMSKNKTKNKVAVPYHSKEWLVCQVGQGKTISLIAKESQVSLQAVAKFAKRYNIISGKRIQQTQLKAYQEKTYLQEQILIKKKLLSQIAKEHNVKSSTIWRYATKFGLQTKKGKSVYPAINKQIIMPYHNIEWLNHQLIGLNKSYSQIGRECGVAHRTIKKWADRFSINENHKVTKVTFAGYEDVYDMAVEDNHNFVANGVFVHNSPHPQIAVFDEVELTEWNIFQEFLNMAHSTDKIKAQNILISTRKFLSGTMQRILDEQRFKVYQYCVFEVARKCIETDCSGCQEFVHGKWADGTIRTFAGVCKGRMRRSDGFIDKADIINRFETLDRNTWETQQECLSPERSGLVHAWFDKPTEGLEIDQYVGLYEGVDWGADDPSVCLWGQKVGQEIRIFDEVYQSGLGVQDFIGVIQGKRLAEGYQDYISETFVDPSGKAARIDFENAGINTSIEFAREVEYGIAVLRSLGEKGLIKISPRCINLIRELGEYRKKPPKDGSVRYSYSGDDHACDALRYLVLGMIAQESGMPTMRMVGSD